MAFSQQQLDELEQTARMAIKQAYAGGEENNSAAQFVEQCLDEVDKDYWQKHLDRDSAEAEQILALLELNSHWSDGADEIFEFTLPENIIYLVISVHFDESGKIMNIALDH